MNRTSVRTFACLALLACACSFAPEAAAQSFKVGVFDPQRVSEETALGRQVQADIGAFREQKQAEITAKQEQLAELEKQLTQQALSLSAERRTRMEKDIQRLKLDIQSLTETATRELQLELGAASDDFQRKLMTVVETFGKDEGFALLLDRSLVAWNADTVDVTTAIVDRFDRMFPGTAPATQGSTPGDQ